MRAIALLFALFFAGSTAIAAEDWMEYAYPDLSFSVNFPTEPKIETTTFQASDGRSLEARLYSVTQDSGQFKLIIAELPDGGAEETALVNRAVDALIQGGTIQLDMEHRIRSFYGRQLGIKGTNGGYSYIAVFYHKKRLYQIEGKAFVAGGQAELDAMRFQQSLDLT
jgi:hypothetical protein